VRWRDGRRSATGGPTSSKEAPGALQQSTSKQQAAGCSKEQAAAERQQPNVHQPRTRSITGLHTATGHP
jgi:hypothetical protein